MADGSAPMPYTEEDVQLVAEAICDGQNNPKHHRWTDFDWKCDECVAELDSPCSRCAKITRTVLDALAEAGRLRPADEKPEVVHLVPGPNSAVTDCCGRSPFELPRTDRLTILAMAVTCPGGSDG